MKRKYIWGIVSAIIGGIISTIIGGIYLHAVSSRAIIDFQVNTLKSINTLELSEYDNTSLLLNLSFTIRNRGETDAESVLEISVENDTLIHTISGSLNSYTENGIKMILFVNKNDEITTPPLYITFNNSTNSFKIDYTIQPLWPPQSFSGWLNHFCFEIKSYQYHPTVYIKNGENQYILSD